MLSLKSTTCTAAKLGSRSFSVATKDKLFDKILIANRGEIACRIIKTCRRLGIKTVAIYSEADQFSKHVRMADEAVCVGPAPTSQSYLVVDAVIDAVRKTGAQAVHPGYGFLSENTKFAKQLEDIGVTFIGPHSKAIFDLGDKIESKKLAKAAKVSTIPGFSGEVPDDQVVKIANEVGYPIMIKASAGGGGKGMRIAWNDQEAVDSFRLSKSEAKSFFGDDRMLIERFIDNPRHIEVQVIGDKHGNVVYLPERECSIQRRNQKVIEEAPSPFIDAETRRKMGEQAASLARAVGYDSAGTVEMLVDSQRNFYFLEMNTRLQVEHPITEAVTQLDLVEHMIRSAAGLPLAFKQEDIKIHGWAMEARVYAEDPFRNFLPSIGRLKSYEEPLPKDPEVRTDSGILEGSEISIFYDPMICKLITHTPTRPATIEKMKEALDSYVVRGPTHNISFLREVLENKRFNEGRLSTKFIPEEFPSGFKGHVLSQVEKTQLLSAAAVLEFLQTKEGYTVTGRLQHSAVPQSGTYSIVIGEEAGQNVTVAPSTKSAHGYTVNINGQSVEVVPPEDANAFVLKFQVDGKPVVAQVMMSKAGGVYKIQFVGTNYDVTVRTPRGQELAKHIPKVEAIDTTKYLLSPMPGAVFSIAVKKGDKVVVGQELAVVEAMKMQNMLRSQRDGVIKNVLVKPGQNVAVEEILLEFEA